ncbi:MAG: hypothetical protein ACTTKH_01670 [Treponema sp.]
MRTQNTFKPFTTHPITPLNRSSKSYISWCYSRTLANVMIVH